MIASAAPKLHSELRSPPSAIPVCIMIENILISQVLRRTLSCSSKFRVCSPEKFEGNGVGQWAPVIITDSKSYGLPNRSPFASGLHKLLLGDLSDEEVCYFLLSGIHGFLRYCEVERKLHKAVEVVASGRIHAPRLSFETFVNYVRRVATATGRGSSGGLTRRQSEIMQLLRKKCSNKEISSVLGISENTVKFHLAKLFSKLGVHDRHAVADSLTQKVHDKAGESDPRLPGLLPGFPGSAHQPCETSLQLVGKLDLRKNKPDLAQFNSD